MNGYDFSEDELKTLTLMNIVTQPASDEDKISALVMVAEIWDRDSFKAEMRQMERDNFVATGLELDGAETGISQPAWCDDGLDDAVIGSLP